MTRPSLRRLERIAVALLSAAAPVPTLAVLPPSVQDSSALLQAWQPVDQPSGGIDREPAPSADNSQLMRETESGQWWPWPWPAVAAKVAAQTANRVDGPQDRLLLFWAVGSHPDNINLVTSNINHARKFEAGQPHVRKPLKIDVYLVHYDFNRSGWQAATGSWYNRNVQFSAELSGVKMWLLKDLLLRDHHRGQANFVNPHDRHDVVDTVTLLEQTRAAHRNLSAIREEQLEHALAMDATTAPVHLNLTEANLTRSEVDAIRSKCNHTGGIHDLGEEQIARLPNVNISNYEYIWMLDEDASFNGTLDMRRMVNSARFSKAKIMTPGILFEGESGDPRVQRQLAKIAKSAHDDVLKQEARKRILDELEQRLEAARRQGEDEMTKSLEAAEDKLLNAIGQDSVKGRDETDKKADEVKSLIASDMNVTAKKELRGRALEDARRALREEREKRWRALGQNVSEKREKLRRHRELMQKKKREETKAALKYMALEEGEAEVEEFIREEMAEEVEEEEEEEEEEELLSESEHRGGVAARQLATEGAEVAQSMNCQSDESLCQFQAPIPKCEFRHTSFVEVSFPLIKPSTLHKILVDCPFCLWNRGTVWGLDRVWCSIAADNADEVGRSCAVLDRSSILHLNRKTLPKWRQDLHSEMTVYNLDTYDEVRAVGSKFWTDELETYDCVKPNALPGNM